ncbi:hypothetical protein CIPO111602_23580 [Citrobacter portucalensis]
MCGRFSQSMTREDYLALLAEEAERDIPYDPVPIGRFNVAPGTKVLLLSERDEKLHLDPVIWGYAPGWWDKSPLINARSETAATSRMFKPLWHFRQLSSSLKVIIYSCQQLNTLSQNSNVVGIGVLNTLH